MLHGQQGSKDSEVKTSKECVGCWAGNGKSRRDRQMILFAVLKGWYFILGGGQPSKGFK